MIPVSVGPGLMALTRTPRSASSDAAVRARERRAAFDAAYALVGRSWVIQDDQVVSKTGWSPYAGMAVGGGPVLTFSRGPSGGAR